MVYNIKAGIMLIFFLISKAAYLLLLTIDVLTYL